MKEVDNITYLGDILSSNGKNYTNIKNRTSKGIGTVSEILEILDNLSLGPHYLITGMLLRNSVLINGMIFNCEVWFNMKKYGKK